MPELVISSNQATADPLVRILTFERPSLEGFRPGQWITIKVPSEAGVIARSYSLLDSEATSICVDLVENGAVSPKLFGAKPASRFQYSGPYGALALPATLPDHLLMIGHYTGMSPIHCICQLMVKHKLSTHLEIVNISPSDTPTLGPEVRQLATRLSAPYSTWDWNNDWSERLQSKLAQRPFVMAAGRNRFIRPLQRQLKDLGYQRSEYALERFG